MNPTQAPVPLILVQHAHQHLIAAGYDSREDVYELHRALSALITEHLATRVPLALHISGTLTSAMNWHVPAFAALVRRAYEEGILELVGSAYAQNVMPLFSPEHNRRQLTETLRLFHRHYGVDPELVRTMWVPERVWNTGHLADVVSDPRLPNGGYTTILLDDRHSYRTHGVDGEYSRAAFDADSAPFAACAGRDPFADRVLPGGDGRHLRPYRLGGAENLTVLPMSSELRYIVPMSTPEQATQLGHLVEAARAGGENSVLVFGDDAERSAGIGLWAPRPWREQSMAPYAATLAALAADPDITVELPSRWLAGREVDVVRTVDPGAFYELVTQQGAGENYEGFWDHAEWAPYRAELETVEALLLAGPADPTPDGLWDTAWHQLMVSAYETGWQEPDEHGRHRPAPWAKATANHVREAHLLALAAAYADRVGAGTGAGMIARLCDVDGDGHDEVVLCNSALFVVVSPRYGGRVVLAADLTQPGGRVVVGNPADDWNWQEEPHRFMDIPRNHPGALADVGAENDSYTVADLCVDSDGARLVLVNTTHGSRLNGLRKTLRLPSGEPSLEVAYDLPPGCGRVGVEFALSPDYLHLIREGAPALAYLPDERPERRGYAAAQTVVWIDIAAAQPALWDRPVEPAAGHAGVLRLSAWGSFALTLRAHDAATVHAAYDIWRRPVLVSTTVPDAAASSAAEALPATGTDDGLASVAG
ncbi:MAG: hypothetical protein ACT4P1_04655 [Sporichthyaceae bacterium]